MYYRISDDEYSGTNVCMENINNKTARVRSGVVIDLEARGLELPFRFEMDIDKQPNGKYEQPRIEPYNTSSGLMHKRFLKILQDAGVNNLQVFPALVKDPRNNAWNEDYVVVNVLSLVSCAVMGESDAIPFAGAYYFDNIVIDDSKTDGLLIFRLADSIMDILVHESVAQKLLEGDFPHLILTPLKER